MILGRGHPAERERRYSDNQPRDGDGKWSGGGGGGSASSGAKLLAGAAASAYLGAAVGGVLAPGPIGMAAGAVGGAVTHLAMAAAIGAQQPRLEPKRSAGGMAPEVRWLPVELRAHGRRLEGYAALFGTEARIGTFTETIRAGAFARSLRSDVVALVDHDASRVLARTRSGTLRLTEDTRGLAFSLDVPDTQPGRDVLALAERGDLGGMSFGFSVPNGGDDWSGERRELRNVDLHEISVVSAWPAYAGTVVNARAVTGTPGARIGLARRYLSTVG